MRNLGIKVIANYNKSREKAEELQRELKSEGYEIEIYKADVSKSEEVKKMIEYIIKKYEKIDILVNNAGISQVKLFTDLTDEDIDNMIDINLKSVFFVTREVLKNMVQKKSGSIINISSVWGTVRADLAKYIIQVLKLGVIGLTKALAKEVRNV